MLPPHGTLSFCSHRPIQRWQAPRCFNKMYFFGNFNYDIVPIKYKLSRENTKDIFGLCSRNLRLDEGCTFMVWQYEFQMNEWIEIEIGVDQKNRNKNLATQKLHIVQSIIHCFVFRELDFHPSSLTFKRWVRVITILLSDAGQHLGIK